MNDKRAWAFGAVVAALLLSAPVGAAVAAPPHAAPEDASQEASNISPGDRAVVQTLARSILARLASTAGPGGACAPPTLDLLRAAVTSAIGQTDPSREIALAALALARQQAPQSAACELVALDDTSDELDGSGATVDDAGTQRGFTLYTGPLPSFVHLLPDP